jgi:hypothetical protein
MRDLDLINSGLLKNARARTAEFIDKIGTTQRQIEREIADNDGLYPFNKGRLNQAEVCRRADVKKGTLQGPLHRESTKPELDKWLLGVRGGLPDGKAIRETVTSRVDHWKAAHTAIAQEYHKANLELAALRKELKVALEHIDALSEEIRQIKSSKIKVLRSASVR